MKRCRAMLKILPYQQSDEFIRTSRDGFLSRGISKLVAYVKLITIRGILK